MGEPLFHRGVFSLLFPLLLLCHCQGATRIAKYTIPLDKRTKNDLAKFRNELLKEHNTKRAIHNSPSLRLDESLNKKAMEIATDAGKQGKFKSDLAAANVFMGCSTYLTVPSGKEVSDAWYNEVCDKNFKFDTVEHNAKARSFSQAVWKESRKLGVGLVTTQKKDGQYCTYAVATYRPPGNIQGFFKENVFKGNFKDSYCCSLGSLTPGCKEKAKKEKTSYILQKAATELSNKKSFLPGSFSVPTKDTSTSYFRLPISLFAAPDPSVNYAAVGMDQLQQDSAGNSGGLTAQVIPSAIAKAEAPIIPRQSVLDTEQQTLLAAPSQQGVSPTYDEGPSQIMVSPLNQGSYVVPQAMGVGDQNGIPGSNHQREMVNLPIEPLQSATAPSMESEPSAQDAPTAQSSQSGVIENNQPMIVQTLPSSTEDDSQQHEMVNTQGPLIENSPQPEPPQQQEFVNSASPDLNAVLPQMEHEISEAQEIRNANDQFPISSPITNQVKPQQQQEFYKMPLMSPAFPTKQMESRPSIFGTQYIGLPVEMPEKPLSPLAYSSLSSNENHDKSSNGQKKLQVKQEIKQQALNETNNLRRLHGSPDLQLNEDLCQEADEFAYKIASSGKFEHSTTRDGENLFYECKKGDDLPPPGEAIKSWYEEVCPGRGIKRKAGGYDFAKELGTQGAGHFTQMIWKNSTDFCLGLATKRVRPDYFCTYYVGRYRRRGNVISRFKENVPKGSFSEAICTDTNPDGISVLSSIITGRTKYGPQVAAPVSAEASAKHTQGMKLIDQSTSSAAQNENEHNITISVPQSPNKAVTIGLNTAASKSPSHIVQQSQETARNAGNQGNYQSGGHSESQAMHFLPNDPNIISTQTETGPTKGANGAASVQAPNQGNDITTQQTTNEQAGLNQSEASPLDKAKTTGEESQRETATTLVDSVKTTSDAKQDSSAFSSQESDNEENLGQKNNFRIQMLKLHNYFRKLHQTPPLELDAILNSEAETRAAAIAQNEAPKTLEGNQDGTGENVYTICHKPEERLSIAKAYLSWYQQVCRNKYRFDKNVPQRGTKKFIQLIWKATKKFGIDYSTAQRSPTTYCTYVVARYSPGSDENSQKENVMKGNFDAARVCRDLSRLASIALGKDEDQEATVGVAEKEIQSRVATPTATPSTATPPTKSSNKDKEEELKAPKIEDLVPQNKQKGHQEITVEQPIATPASGPSNLATASSSNQSEGSKEGEANPPASSEEEEEETQPSSQMTPSRVKTTSSNKEQENDNSNVVEKVEDEADTQEDSKEPQASAFVTRLQEDTIKLYNVLRAIHRSPAINADEALSRSADDHIDELIRAETSSTRREESADLGENLYVDCNSKRHRPTAKRVVESWYQGVCDYDPENPKTALSANVGKFIQMVWKQTSRLGIAVRSKVTNDGLHCTYIMAKHFPPRTDSAVKENVYMGSFDKVKMCEKDGIDDLATRTLGNEDESPLEEEIIESPYEKESLDRNKNRKENESDINTEQDNLSGNARPEKTEEEKESLHNDQANAGSGSKPNKTQQHQSSLSHTWKQTQGEKQSHSQDEKQDQTKSPHEGKTHAQKPTLSENKENQYADDTTSSDDEPANHDQKSAQENRPNQSSSFTSQESNSQGVETPKPGKTAGLGEKNASSPQSHENQSPTLAPTSTPKTTPEVNKTSKAAKEALQAAAVLAHNTLRSIHNAPSLQIDSTMSADAEKFAETLAEELKKKKREKSTKVALRHSDTDDGENLAMKCDDVNRLTAEEATKTWYSEVCSKPYDFQKEGPQDHGHFTQVVWKKTRKLGIGRATFRISDGTCAVIVARYRPAGNFMRRFVENVDKGDFKNAICDDLTEVVRRKVNLNSSVDTSLFPKHKSGDGQVVTKDSSQTGSSVPPDTKEPVLPEKVQENVPTTPVPFGTGGTQTSSKPTPKWLPTALIRPTDLVNLEEEEAQEEEEELEGPERIDQLIKEAEEKASYEEKEENKVDDQAKAKDHTEDHANLMVPGSLNPLTSGANQSTSKGSSKRNSTSLELHKEASNPSIQDKESSKDMTTVAEEVQVHKTDFEKAGNEASVPSLKTLHGSAVELTITPTKETIVNMFSSHAKSEKHQKLATSNKEFGGALKKSQEAIQADQKEVNADGLNAHNALRDIHGVPPLELDPVLSAKASKNAFEIVKIGELSDDTSILQNMKRQIIRKMSIGQGAQGLGKNVMVHCSSNKEDLPVKKAVLMWYKEVCRDKNSFQSGSYSGQINHFTQVVWKSSTKVGLGKSTLSIRDDMCTVIIALYNPAGNKFSQFRENVVQGQFTPSLCTSGKLERMLKISEPETSTPDPNGKKRDDADRDKQNTQSVEHVESSDEDADAEDKTGGKLPTTKITMTTFRYPDTPSRTTPTLRPGLSTVLPTKKVAEKSKDEDPVESKEDDSEEERAFQNEALKEHNKLRDIHGSPPLQLDSDLSKRAALLAGEFARDGTTSRSKIKSIEKAGENMFVTCGKNAEENLGEKSTIDWYREGCEKAYMFGEGKEHGENRHFTQLLWKGSKRFGIGRRQVKRGDLTCTYVAALYSPTGNVDGQYKDNVPKGAFSSIFCGQIINEGAIKRQTIPHVSHNKSHRKEAKRKRNFIFRDTEKGKRVDSMIRKSTSSDHHHKKRSKTEKHGA